MLNRPFFNKSVQELELVFQERIDEYDLLTALISELSFRKTNRAIELRGKINEQLTHLGAQNKSGNQNHSGERLEQPQTSERFQISIDEAISTTTPITQDKSKIHSTSATTNQPENIISAWTVLEVLSPQTFLKIEDLTNGDKFKVSKQKNLQWIWETGGEKSKKDYRLYYQIVLGTIDMKSGVDSLMNVYADTRAERPKVRGEAILATVMIDKEGCLVQEDPVQISSFAWGLPVAIRSNLKELAKWMEFEETLIKGLLKQLGVNQNNQETPVFLSNETISKAYQWLATQLDLDTSMLKPPEFAIKTYQYFKDKSSPESLLLNSFFLKDLSRAQNLIKTNNIPDNLKRYLGTIKPTDRFNLLTDNLALARAIQPKKFPLSSWPANGRHPLVTLQQCAVNLAVNDLKDGGLLAVNGPPGTGKTTLLRDIVAALVTERADIMASYADPETAFTHTEKIAKSGAFLHLYKIDEKLRGYEIVVASSNNKAVENVSSELPGITAIASDATELRYFKSVSDLLLERDTWGTIAAVLGNSSNRYSFTSKFWWDKDYGLQKYLLQASGTPVLIPDPNDQSAQRPPHILALENAPANHADALKKWVLARGNFKQAKSAVVKSLEELQKIYDLQLKINDFQKSILDLNIEIQKLTTLLEQLESKAKNQTNEIKQHTSLRDLAQTAFNQSKSTRSGFFSRLFATSKYKSWKLIHQENIDKLSEVNNLLEKTTNQQIQLQQIILSSKSNIGHLQLNIRNGELKVSAHLKTIADIKILHAGAYVDDNFFEKTHKDKQLAAPWLSEIVALQRHKLFEASIALQKAFVDAAAKPIRHNMNMLVDGFCMKSLGSAKKDELIPHIWSTLFFLVPVVSTTFASVGRMFINIKEEELGWLLIDEAGQALPQAAVGAIMRTKKAVVVGDPLQIEPVVMLPNLLTKAISAQFAIDPILYNAPEASVQTLADNATAYFASFETGAGSRTVGVPLLVHRRCAEPMFTISNAIAYENLMVQAKSKGTSAIGTILGESSWIHTEGHSIDKWCEQEGKVVLDLLTQLKNKKCIPDLYIVTPFVVVQDNMRKMIRESGILDGWVDDADKWPRDRIGTVHTVQGREAEAVIFILGASNPEQQGARHWAGGTPNLPNVAVTRAKEVLYVIGNRDLWRTAGHFQWLASKLN